MDVEEGFKELRRSYLLGVAGRETRWRRVNLAPFVDSAEVGGACTGRIEAQYEFGLGLTKKCSFLVEQAVTRIYTKVINIYGLKDLTVSGTGLSYVTAVRQKLR